MPCRVPSSPNGPCRIGKTTSTAPSTAPASSSATSAPDLVGSGVSVSAVPVASTEGSASWLSPIAAVSASASTQPPSGVMPIGTGSNLPGSRCRNTLAADTHDTACSLLRPPNTTATLIRFVMPKTVPGGFGGLVPALLGSPLRFDTPAEQAPDRLADRNSLVAHPMDGVGQRHLHVVRGGQRPHRCARLHTLGQDRKSV